MEDEEMTNPGEETMDKCQNSNHDMYTEFFEHGCPSCHPQPRSPEAPVTNAEKEKCAKCLGNKDVWVENVLGPGQHKEPCPDCAAPSWCSSFGKG